MKINPLRQLRETNGITMTDAAKSAGISLSYWSDFENGRSPVPSDRLADIVRAAGGDDSDVQQVKEWNTERRLANVMEKSDGVVHSLMGEQEKKTLESMQEKLDMLVILVRSYASGEAASRADAADDMAAISELRDENRLLREKNQILRENNAKLRIAFEENADEIERLRSLITNEVTSETPVEVRNRRIPRGVARYGDIR